MTLPIYDIESQIVTALRDHTRVILEAPTGSGKSTQVPQMLLNHGFAKRGSIVVMQPRRLAARLLARRVAGEQGCELGQTIGYQVRFERCVGPQTLVRYETDGVLLRHLQRDPQLRDVAVVVFDEFHERHLYAELMLGFALRLQSTTRPDLRIVVMSATLDAAALEEQLAPCRVVRAEGRTFPVEIQHLAPNAKVEKLPVWDLAARMLPEALRAQPAGDVLVFMPGGYEIRRTIEALRRLPETRAYDILPLYGDLPPAEQDRAVSRGGRPRIIVSTNVAETSLTIEGVTLVIDAGLARKARFDQRRGINTLLIERISRASAEQRAGRAGRVRPGTCLRLWTAREHAARPARDEAELHRVDLAETVLTLKRLGEPDAADFPWIEAPPVAALARAETLLAELGATAKDGSLTDTGRRLSAFPLHPRLGRMLLAAEYFGCVPAACELAALIEEAPVLVRTRSAGVVKQRLQLVGDNDDSDIRLLRAALHFAQAHRFNRDDCEPYGIHAVSCRRVTAMADQLLRLSRSLGLDDSATDTPPENLYRSLLAAFPDHVAQRLGGGRASRCAVVHGRRGTVERDSVVGAYPLLLAAEIQEIGGSHGQVDVRLSCLTVIQAEWLEAQFPDHFSKSRAVFFDATGKQVMAEERTLYMDLVLTSKRLADVSAAESAEVLAAEIMAGRLKLKQWDDAVEHWIARVNLVAEHRPDYGIAPIDDEARQALIEQICLGARSRKDLKLRPVLRLVKDWCDAGQRAAIEHAAPERVTLQNGRGCRVHYDDSAGPYIAARIQELYDTHETPTLCDGTVKVRVRVLAPNQRPVQITDDLGGFWGESYERAKKELRGRYPKHEWR